MTFKPVYAFDIDGVLCSTREVHRAALEEHLGVTLYDGGDYSTFGFGHDSDEVLEQLRECAMDLWRRPTVFADGEAFGQHVIRELAFDDRFVGFVTRRHPMLYAETWGWLERKGFPLGLPERLHHMDGDVESKAQRSLKMGATHLVEDSPREAWDAAKDGIRVVVLRANYNAEFEKKWQQNRAEPSGPDAEIWARLSFITTLDELL